MSLLTEVLRAGAGAGAGAGASASGSASGLSATPDAPHRPLAAVVVGGGGALGSAVLERLLVRRRFAPVRVLVTRGLSAAVHGLETVVVDDFSAGGGGSLVSSDDAATAAAANHPPLGDLAIVVFDRPRHANGRELAFARPQPQQLPAIAGWLAARRVRSLLVVLPHATNSLPEALKSGLANLDEQAVAMLGFEHLVIVRSAQAPATVRARRWLQRVADAALAQLAFMVPPSNLPVRAAKVAQFVVELAAQLPSRPAGTRVAPPELVWQAAQLPDPAELVGAWLDGRALPLPAPRRPRR